jgi:hypothetical protein
MKSRNDNTEPNSENAEGLLEAFCKGLPEHVMVMVAKVALVGIELTEEWVEVGALGNPFSCSMSP